VSSPPSARRSMRKSVWSRCGPRSGSTSRPRGASCSSSAGGTRAAAAETKIAAKGACSGQPRLPSPAASSVALDREHRAHEPRQDGRGVARSRSHLERAIAGAQRERFEHPRHHVGLRDGLALADRQRAVLVGQLDLLLRHELVSGHLAHRGEHAWVADAARLQLQRHHLCTPVREIDRAHAPPLENRIDRDTLARP